MEGPDAVVVPMFPLGTVLFPHGVLPIHVFEPRYRAMVDDCLAGEGRFGVVLIERGSEVGGGDTRFGTGTIANIVQAGRFPDGRWALATVGAERLTVVEWLPDAPYPRAAVTLRAEPEPTRDAHASIDLVRERLTRVHELLAALGLPAHQGDVLVSPDVVGASYEAAILSPIGPLDAQSLLELDDAVDRLDRLAELLAHEIEMLEFRLSG
jgi:Lon protease-like protein